MSSFRPNPEDIGPDGYLKDTKSADEFKEKIAEFNDNLYGEGRIERGDLIELDDDVVVDTSTPEVKTAGFMGIPKIAWIAIIGVGLYYAYSKGMFKKLMK